LFFQEDNKFWVMDLLSGNGLIVNENFVDEKDLSHGDTIKIGSFTLRFSEDLERSKDKIYITGNEIDIQELDLSFPPSPQVEEEEKSKIKPLGQMIRNSKDANVCRLALKNRLLSCAQIRGLVTQLEEQDKKQSLVTEAIIDNQWLKQEDIENLLKEHNYYKVRNKDLRLIQSAIVEKVIKEKQAQECLVLQEQYYKQQNQLPRIGELLVQKGYMSVQENNRLLRAILEKQKEV
jgi:hypothetical protein